jgi:hypothetical protein
MNRKTIGGVLAILGVALIAIGLAVAFIIVPGMKQFPSDVNTTRTYEGTVPVQLNPDTFEFMTNLSVDLTRHFMTVETDGDKALVREEQTLSVKDGPVLQEIVKYHAINRKTMEGLMTYPAKWDGEENLFPRQGLSLGWPIDTKKKDYTGWSDDYRATVELRYEEEVEHPRAKINTYYFTAQSDARPIVPEAVAAMHLPTELSQTQLTGLVSGMEGMDALAPIIPVLLNSAGWPDPVPLSYTYEYRGEYWVDPASGVLIDTHKVEIRKVGVSDELMAALGEKLGTLTSIIPASLLPEGFNPDMFSSLLPMTVSQLEYQATDQSVQDAKKDAEDASNKIRLYGTFLPAAAIAAGLVLGVLGIILFTRKP